MYTSASMVKMRQKVLASFMEQGSTFRILIATTAFGMGADCKDIRQIMHWGPPSLIEDYVQETRRGGYQSQAILFNCMHNAHRSLTPAVKHYSKDSCLCRRRTLFHDFVFCSDSDLVTSQDAGVVMFVLKRVYVDADSLFEISIAAHTVIFYGYALTFAFTEIIVKPR